MQSIASDQEQNSATKTQRGLKDRPRSSRPPVLFIRDLRTIVYSVKKNRRLSSKEIKSDVRRYLKKDVGASTIRSLLYKCELKGRVARKKPFVSQINRRKRLKFAMDHRNWIVERGTVVGRKEIQQAWQRSACLCAESLTEEFLPCCTQRTVKGSGGSIMVWACFSTKCPGPLVRLTGNVDHHDYIELLDTVVKPYTEEDIF